MLNPPLSLLSDDLLAYIVEHISNLPFREEHLHNLSLTDRAFTQICQTYIFWSLELGMGSGAKSKISKKLAKIKKILDDKPSVANRVCVIEIRVLHERNAWLLNDPTLISILQLLAKSLMPPHELRFGGPMFSQLTIEDPILFVARLTQSFFSQTLTILHLTECKNVPLPLFLICDKLREVFLDCVGAAEESYSEYPQEYRSSQDRELPALEVFVYRDLHSVVKQMITSPPRFHTPVVLWSKLRILTLSPHEEEEMACLQPILDAASNALEELYLTRLCVGERNQLPLAGLLNLKDLSRLHVFALYAIIKFNTKESGALRDINIVLNTISASNQVANLSFNFDISSKHPFGGCLEQDWIGLCDEITRISAGKPLELELQTKVSSEGFQSPDIGDSAIYRRIEETTASLSDFPKICCHFWNPTCWSSGLAPFPRGQARSRCRR